MKKNKLNWKHRLVVEQYLINGKSQKDAYKSIYPVSSSKNCESRSSELFARQEVIDYLKHREEQIVKKYDLSRERVIRELCELLADCKDEKNAMKDRTNWGKAIQIINKMFGYDEPDKIDVTHQIFHADFGIDNNDDNVSNTNNDDNETV